MSQTARPTKTFSPAGTSLTFRRIGYGAMQLAGPNVLGPPADVGEAVEVLREAVALGVNHIDTSDYYGPHVTNEIIRRALHPYPDDLTIVTKVGYRRPADGSWRVASSAPDLEAAIHDNLRNLGLESVDVVNLRFSGPDATVEVPLSVLMRLQSQGLVRHLGVSNATRAQIVKARSMTQIVCVQNEYNIALREDDELIDELDAAGIAYTPFFPIGGFRPLQMDILKSVAQSLGATPTQVALAWLLQRSANILLIPGTSSRAHLQENLRAADLVLPPEAVASLDAIAG